MVKHYNIVVKGKVQGVWYRKSTLEKAWKLDVRGIVKNMSDGNVYIEVEGNKTQLKTFLDWCGKGPELAEVTDVSIEEGDVLPYTMFEIRY
ncbi:acylphosphatase [Aquimarina amphilecti]|uniref:acylphosphatase n=1 Tax=Aquimarina amphilecti TaxID=1038014 RepID=A0A1H7M7V7_AQUAM|nr:acylphosphatase [Aquimarina amphilecti]SEL07274.1 acylphosphatase [Aquimarina amphilecti]